MRSAIFHTPGRPLVLEDRPIPEPGATQVLIQVGRCGVCGSDLKMTDPSSPMTFEAGCALGHEYAGEVVARGADVQGLAVGDRVAAMPATSCGRCEACRAGDPYACTACRYIMGGFSEYTVAEAAYVVKLPAALSLADGALVEPLACGAQAARLAGLTPDARVLVLGAGPIGLTCVFWARKAGCERIAVAALSRRNAAMAEALGASAFLTGSEDLSARASEALCGPPDAVFECAGAPGLIGAALDCVRSKGVVVSAGMCLEPEPLPTAMATFKQARLQFSLAYTLADFQRAADALEAGHVEPRALVSETIALDALPDRLEAMRRERARGKVMVALT